MRRRPVSCIDRVGKGQRKENEPPLNLNPSFATGEGSLEEKDDVAICPMLFSIVACLYVLLAPSNP